MQAAQMRLAERGEQCAVSGGTGSGDCANQIRGLSSWGSTRKTFLDKISTKSGHHSDLGSLRPPPPVLRAIHNPENRT